MNLDTYWLSTLYFPVGLAIGFIAAAPIGPVNILVIQRALQFGRRSALTLGAGAALGDALFAALAAFGVRALMLLLDQHTPILKIVGGLIMLGFAWYLLRHPPHLVDTGGASPNGGNSLIAALLMTVTNPATLVWFGGAFGSVGFQEIGHGSMRSLAHSGQLVLGVFLGSMLWWVMIASGAVQFRSRVNDRTLARINSGVALVMLIFGLAAIAGVAWTRLKA